MAEEPVVVQDEGVYVGPPKLIVFGGRGFVGSAVCKQALNTGLHVMAISRSGESCNAMSWLPMYNMHDCVATLLVHCACLPAFRSSCGVVVFSSYV